MKPVSRALGAVFSSLPWCCIVPALLGLLGATSSSAARSLVADPAAKLVLLALSVALLARAHYDVTWRGHGATWARGIVWGSTAFVLVSWWIRL